MALRRKEFVGTKYSPELDAKLDHQQADIVDELITPHVKIPERLGGGKITCRVPAQVPDAQPIQARGHIVWNRAYQFQARGPSYLDGSDR